MATWPSNPDWTDLSNINKGNEYVGGDGIYYSDLNAIVKNLLVIKTQLDKLSYSIDITVENCTPDSQNPTKIIFAGTTTLKYTAVTGYDLPTSVNITGATSTWTVSNGVGTLTLKDPTSNITGSIVATIHKYTLTIRPTNLISSPSNPRTIAYNGSVTLSFTAMQGYAVPDSSDDITIVGATIASYERLDTTHCNVIVVNPTKNVTIVINGVARIYTITPAITNGTADSSNPATITYRQTATLMFSANTGYNLPSTISVTGAQYTWEASTGVLDLSNPTANVTISIACERVTYAISYDLRNCEYNKNNATTIAYGSSVTLEFSASTGYTLESTPVVTNATASAVTYTDDTKETATITISNPTGAVGISWYATEAVTKLATPTNVSISDTVLSWDAVENAESYDILADGVVIGNTTGDVTYTITTTVTNGTYTGDTSITADGTATVTITANDGYTLPDEVTVTGASQTWNKETGTLSISNPTGNVTVTAVCEAVGETWVLNEAPIISGSNIYNNIEMTYSGQQRIYPIKSLKIYEYSDGPMTSYAILGEESSIFDDISTIYALYDSYNGWGSYNGVSYNVWTFAQPVTDPALLAWLQANGTKQ